MVSIVPIPGTNEWRVVEKTGKIDGDCPAYRRCANLNTPAACNWLLSDHGIGAKEGLCIACRLNRTIPDLSVPENGVLWGRFEEAKRRMVSTLLALEIPVHSKEENPEKGLAFDFLRSPKDGPRVLTGHDNGLITMNIEEADASIREGIRENLNEPYRTLLGHFRHEVGHYYWDRLIPDTGWIDEFRRLFGDERVDYGESITKNYKEGPPADWQQRFRKFVCELPSLGGLGGDLGSPAAHGRHAGDGVEFWAGSSRVGFGDRALSERSAVQSR